MKRLLSILLLGGLASLPLGAQSAEPPPPPAQNQQQDQLERGRQLLDQMVQALGGDAWLNRKDMQFHGRIASFFQGRPNGMVIEFDAWHRFPDVTHPEAMRIGFFTDKSMIR